MSIELGLDTCPAAAFLGPSTARVTWLMGLAKLMGLGTFQPAVAGGDFLAAGVVATFHLKTSTGLRSCVVDVGGAPA